MTRKDALIALRDEISIGATFCARSCLDAGFTEQQASRAEDVTLRGSLDAALALHEAVLPGWGWEIYDEGVARVWPRPLGDDVYVSGRNDVVARAWLLAILEALIAQEQDT